MAALLAAFVCVATMIIRLPSPLGGYINLGDCVVLISGWLLSPLYGFAAAAVGSAMADVFSGYIMYAPATFVIKGLMALCAHYIGKKGGLMRNIMGGTCAEALMVVGYYVFEGFVYGFVPSLVNIPANAVQGLFGVVSAVVLIKLFEKHGIGKAAE